MPYYQDGDLKFYLYGDDEAPAPSPALKVPGRVGQEFATIINSMGYGEKFEDPYFPATLESIGPDTLNGPLNQYTIQWLRPAEILKYLQEPRKNAQQAKDNLDMLRNQQAEGIMSPLNIRLLEQLEGLEAQMLKDLSEPAFGDEPLFHGPFDEFGVNQGGVGDCWFLAVLAEAAIRPDCINTLVPENNVTVGFGRGIFHFRFWCRGKWIDIVVDDRLPCSFWRSNGSFVGTSFSKPTAKGGFWASLLEKAYAKMYGKYDNIALGYPVDAMKDFTGGFIQTYLNSNVESNRTGNVNWKQVITEGISTNSLMSVGTVSKCPPGKEVPRGPNDPPGGEHISIDGMVCGHAYTLLDIQDVTSTSDGATATLVKLRNPWGNDKEWTGAFCDTDGNWETVEPNLRNPIEKQGQGEFWMPLDDLVFTYMDALNLCRWSKGFRGNVEGTISDSGYQCLQITSNFTPETPSLNVQVNNLAGTSGFYIDLKPNDPNIAIEENGVSLNCGLIVNIMYENYTRSGLSPGIPAFGFAVYFAYGEQPMDGQDFSQFSQYYKNPNYSYTGGGRPRDVNYAANLPTGTAFIVPWVDNIPAESEPYLIRIAAEGKIYPFPN